MPASLFLFLISNLFSGRSVPWQLRRNLLLLNRTPLAYSLESVLSHWRLLCKDPPKGFEKFFKPDASKKASENVPKQKQEANDIELTTKEEKIPKRDAESPPSKPSTPKPIDQWTFGNFRSQAKLREPPILLSLNY